MKTAKKTSESGLSQVIEEKLGVYFRNLNGHQPGCSLYHEIIQEVERPLVQMALRQSGGHKGKAADLLGINRNTLRKKMQELDIRD